MIKINSNNIDKNIKTYYNKLNMYPERVLEVPHSGTSFFAEIFKMTKSLRKERKKKKKLSVVLAGAMIGGELVTGIGSFTLPVNAADSSFAGEEWYDQIDKVEENREPAHAYFTPYESAEKALTNEKSVLDVDESQAGMTSKFQAPSRRSRMQTAISNTKSRSM